MAWAAPRTDGRSASPVAVRQRLLHASRNNATVWYFEVHLGGSSLEQAAQQLPPGRPHLRAARQLLCQRLNVAGASLAWPRPGLLGVHLLVQEDSSETPAGSTWSHWLVRSHLRGDLADAAKALLRTAPKGFDTLEVENVTAPSPVKDFWVDASEEVLDLGLELTGASLQEASISKSVTNGFIWNHRLQARDLLLWIDGRPSTEMSPEELAAELRSVRPLRLGFVRPGAEGAVQSPIVRSPGSISDVNEQVDQEIQELRGRRKHLQQLQQKLLEAQAQQLSGALPGHATPGALGALDRAGSVPGATAAMSGPGAEPLEEAAKATAARAREEAAAEPWNIRSKEQLVVKEAAQARLEASAAQEVQQKTEPNSSSRRQNPTAAAAASRTQQQQQQELERLQQEQRRGEIVAEAAGEQAERLHINKKSLAVRKQEEAEHACDEAKKDGAAARHEAHEDVWDASEEVLDLELTGASLEASISKSVTNGYVRNRLQARDPLVDGFLGPSAETFPTSPEELAEVQSVRPRQGFVRPDASTVQSHMVRSQKGSISDEVDQDIQELPGRHKQLQKPLEAASAQQLSAQGLDAAGLDGSGALPGRATAGVPGATAAMSGPGAELLEEAAQAAAARAREEAAAELWNLRSEEQLVVKEAEEAAAQARLEASVAPALAWARAEEEVLQELERLQQEQRREESVAGAVREQAERLHMEESLAVRKQEEAEHAREEAKKDGAAARHEAREALDAELEQLRLQRGEALLASEEAKEALEMAEAKEKVTTECEEAAAKEVKNWEVLLEQREKEMLQVAEVRERELEAEAVVKYEQREKELLFPALATAKAEREEAAAARSHARDYAMQEVASELEKLRQGQSEAQLARSEAQVARAEVMKQEGEIRRMEDEAAQEVLKWENAVAIKERDALSRYAEKEQQLLGESKAEQQVAASLRLRELALWTGEEDLMATLRKRDHAILKQEKKVEEMEMPAEAMAERARDRAADLAESLQERAQALALTAEAREAKLQQREEELNSMVADQLRAMEDLQKLRSEFHKAETAAVIFEADLVQKEMGSRVLMLDAKSRDAQLGFVVGGFDTGRGLLVSKVLHGSWAEQKGLKEGDELTSLDGKDVKDLKEPELLEALQSQRPLKLGFLKPDPKLPAAAPAKTVPTTPVAIAAPGAEPGAEQEFWPASEKQAEAVELLADASVKQLGLDLTGVPPSAVRIKQVLPDSWADVQAVHAGDELVKVNGQLTSSLTQQQIGLALRQTRPLRLTLARPVTGSTRSSAARGSQAPPWAAREAGKVLTFEAKEADERLGFKAGGKPPGEVYVEKLFPNLWAEKQGLRLKDVLEELNGQRLSEMQPEQLDQLIKTRPLTLVFRRRDGGPGDVAPGGPAGGLAAAGARLAMAQKAVKPKAKAEPLAPSGPLKESVDLELPVGEKQLGFVPWGLPPARVMVRQVTGARAQKALLQVGHELAEVNGVHVRDIPRVELERTLLTRPLRLHFVASEASAGAFAVPSARDAEIEDEEVQAGILDLVATPEHDHLGFETTSSLNFNAVEVAKVEPGSWAQRMRIRMGDHLLSIDGTAVGSFASSSLQEAIRSRARAMRLRFRRQGQNILDEDQRRLDVLATEADAELGFLMSGQPPSEVLVFKVIPGSWAAQRGLQEKDELVAVAGQPVSALSGAALMRYVQSVRPLRLRFHLAPGGPQPARAKPKAAPKVVSAAKEVPETKEAEASPVPKAKGRMGRAKLAQMLVGDMMKGMSQEEEVPSSPPAAPSSPPAAAPPAAPAAPKPAPKPATPAPVAPKPVAPAPKPKAAQAAPASRPPARGVPPATTGRPSERAPAAQDDSSSDDDAMIEKSAGTQDKDLGFEIAPRGSGAAMCFVVSAVQPGGWAQRQRIGVGNELLSIGGQVAKKMKLEDIQKMLAPDGVRPLRFWLQADMGS